MNEHALTITADVRPADLLRMQFHVTPRLPATWIVLGLLMTFAMGLGIADQVGRVGLPVALLAGLVLGLGALLLTVPFQLALILTFVYVIASETNGQLGRQQFTIGDAGLVERNAASTVETRWEQLRGFWKTRHAIYVPSLFPNFHLIPRHAFPDDAAYERFAEALLERIDRGRGS